VAAGDSAQRHCVNCVHVASLLCSRTRQVFWRQLPHAGLARQQRAPRAGRVRAQRRDQADAGDHHAARTRRRRSAKAPYARRRRRRRRRRVRCGAGGEAARRRAGGCHARRSARHATAHTARRRRRKGCVWALTSPPRHARVAPHFWVTPSALRPPVPTPAQHPHPPRQRTARSAVATRPRRACAARRFRPRAAAARTSTRRGGVWGSLLLRSPRRRPRRRRRRARAPAALGAAMLARERLSSWAERCGAACARHALLPSERLRLRFSCAGVVCGH
jgi:hypothetical protein